MLGTRLDPEDEEEERQNKDCHNHVRFKHGAEDGSGNGGNADQHEAQNQHLRSPLGSIGRATDKRAGIGVHVTTPSGDLNP
jgi:hypothetical protein